MWDIVSRQWCFTLWHVRISLSHGMDCCGLVSVQAGGMSLLAGQQKNKHFSNNGALLCLRLRMATSCGELRPLQLLKQASLCIVPSCHHAEVRSFDRQKYSLGIFTPPQKKLIFKKNGKNKQGKLNPWNESVAPFWSKSQEERRRRRGKKKERKKRS